MPVPSPDGGTIPAAAPVWDLVIRNGRIADGSGGPAFGADVAIKDGRIARVGDVPAPGQTEIDAAGLVVAPGFIDVHTHSENVVNIPLVENYVRMGVTTVVTGNCGASAQRIGAFLDQVRDRRVSLNVATLVGHNTVRREAMQPPYDRLPTDAEMARMRELVEEGMRDGAVGLSTGLIYSPGVFAQTEEIVELARVAAALGGIYTSHMRNESTGILGALDEAFRVAREAGIRAEISHIKLSGPSAWGRAEEVVAAIERARAEGLDVAQDMYVYTASSTDLGALVPSWAREGGPEELGRRIDDPAQKARIVAEMKASLLEQGRTSYDYAVVAACAAEPGLAGHSVEQLAQLKHGTRTVDGQIEAVLDVERAGGAGAVFHGIDERDLQVFLSHRRTMVGSDGGPHQPGPDVPHPRSYGNNARVLARYVRELGVLRLEEAVRRMTSLPASTFGLADRGLVREGCRADLALFDPQAVQDTAAFGDPHHYALGIPYVLVNGVPVVSQGSHTGARPGVPLRGQDHPDPRGAEVDRRE